MQEETDGRVFTEGIGFTKIENVLLAPEQAFEKGVTVNTLIIGTFEPPVLVVNARISPLPERDDNPIRLLLCVQLYTVFATREPLKTMLFVRVPLQLT